MHDQELGVIDKVDEGVTIPAFEEENTRRCASALTATPSPPPPIDGPWSAFAKQRAGAGTDLVLVP